MSALSKKYKINYKRRYTIPKNKKQRSRKSIKVYHTRVKRSTRKRKYYVGGDIQAPAINNIFPSGQSYQPNTDCLEKECDKKDDADEMTTTCLNTCIVMKLFRQTLDDSEKQALERIYPKFTAEERQHVQDMTEKYITNYVDSLFSRSIFSKNNVDLTPENTQKLNELLEVIKPTYVDYLIEDSNLSADIKETIKAITQHTIVPTIVPTPAPASTTINVPTTAPTTAPTPAPASTTINVPTTAPTTAPTDAHAAAPTSAPTDAPAPIDNAVVEAEPAKKNVASSQIPNNP